jgi:chromosome segregation ATPase
MSETNPLLSNSTVQGAAKSIEGLLDSKGVIKKPQKEAAPVEQVEPEAKAEDNQEVQQQTETQPEEQEVAVEEEASEENANEEQTTDRHQVKVNGETIEVDLEELKAGYQKDADYRRKTEEIAIEKKQLQSEKDRLAKEYSSKIEDLNSLTATLNAEINNELNSQDLDKLFEEDPAEATRLERKLRRRRETIKASQDKLRRHQQEQFQKVLAEEQRKVAIKYPELSDPEKAPGSFLKMRNYLSNKGFSEKEISAVYDSRFFDVIMDGVRYVDFANRPKSNPAKKIVKPSQVVKPGIKSTREDKESQSRFDKLKTLKRSGSTKDATDLLKRYL